jgi:hypothetical protein
MVGQFVGARFHRGVDAYDTFGKFVRGMISGDEVLGSGGYDAFKAMEFYFQIGNLNIANQKVAILPTDELWDEIYNVLLTMQQSPNEIENLAKNEYNNTPVWDVDKISDSYSRLVSIFNSTDINKFDIDITPYLKKLEKDELVVMDATADDLIRRRVASNYPDIPLPTYAEFFSEDWDIVLKSSDGKKEVELWKQFAPTFADLGIIPPDSSKPEDSLACAREKTDVMEPYFWFHHQKSRQEQINRAKRTVFKIEDQRIQSITKYKISLDLGVEQIRAIAPDARKATIFEKILEAWRNDQKKIGKVVKDADRNVEWIDIEDRDGNQIGVFEPKGPTVSNGEFRISTSLGRGLRIKSVDGNDSWDPASEEHNKALTTRLLQSVPDNLLAMARSLPAFRLWFVEWDNNQGRFTRERNGRVIRLLDDLYTTNAILSIIVTESKDDGAVAEVSVLNTVGTFDTDSFVLPSEAKVYANNQNAGTIEQDDESEQYLRRMKIQTGTGIVIQMGYSSNPSSLKTVFTGSITEIEPGKVVRFVAQGYKAELDQDVDIRVNRDSAAEAVRQLVQLGDKTDANPTPHLGRKLDSKDMENDKLIALIGSVRMSETGVLGMEGPGGWWNRSFGMRVNTAIRNVYVQTSTGPTNTISQGWQDFKETIGQLPILGNLFHVPDGEWSFHGVTAWQGLQEMTRHLPGNIVSVRPYSTEGTIFFGMPDQPYQYREIKPFEQQRWNQTHGVKRFKAAVGMLVGTLNAFMGSDYGTTDQNLLQMHLQQARTNGKRWNSEAFNAWSPWFDSTNEYQNTTRVSERIRNGKTDAVTVDDISPSYLGYLKWAQEVGSGFSGASFWRSLNWDNAVTVSAAGWTYSGLYESLGLDFSQDWQYLESYNPEFAKFVFYAFYRLPYLKPSSIGSNFEAKWNSFVREGMVPLLNRDGSPNRTFMDWTRWVAAPNEGNSGFYSESTSGFANVIYETDSFWLGSEVYINRQIALIRELIRTKKISEVDGNAIIAAHQETLKKLKEAGPVKDQMFPFAVLSGGPDERRLSQVLFDYFPRFRLFVHYLAKWLRREQGKIDKSDAFKDLDVQRDLDALSSTALFPWQKPFRDFHVVFSNHDIINNSIVASMSEMYNTFVIRHPGESLPEAANVVSADGSSSSFIEAKEWKSFPPVDGVPFNNRLKRDMRKLAVCIEPNANTEARVGSTLLSNMCDGVRGMYRGEIKILGKVVFPWDVVAIADDVNGMYGLVEVDRVTHEFTAETGWVTTIVPHAYCHPSNPFAGWQLTTTPDWVTWVNAGANLLTLASIVLPVFRAVGAARGLLMRGVAEKFIASRMAVRETANVGQDLLMGMAKHEFVLVGGEKLGENGLRAVLKEEMKGYVDEVLKRGLLTKEVIAGLEGATQSAWSAGVGRYLAQNWLHVLGHVGRTLGTWALTAQGLDVVTSLVFGLGARPRMDSMRLPVDLRVLTYKGAPLVAGLDLEDKDFDTFDTKALGLYEDWMKTMKAWFTPASDSFLDSNHNPGMPR